MLTGAARLATDPRNPQGCLWVNATLTAGAPTDPLSIELAAGRVAGQARLRDRFKRAVAEGEALNHRCKMTPSLDLRSKTSDWKVGRLR